MKHTTISPKSIALTILLILGVFFLPALVGCKGKKSSTTNIVEGKFNVAFVYVGPIGDGGWTYAHNQARLQIEKELDFVHTTYIENVAEGTDAKQVIADLARKKYDLIITTSFGYMDPTKEVAEQFPKTKFLHITGFKSNDSNFGNLMGAMESMKYLAGMIAGARAKEDGQTKIGYIAPFPIAEVIRLINATALGIKDTCPTCILEIRWINSWFDPVKEKEAAESLLQVGADVIITGADTPGPIAAAGQMGKWGIGYDSPNACQVDPKHCLTVSYWNWAPAYIQIIQEIRANKWKGGNRYLDVDSGIVGLYGFMEGEKPPTGVPEWVIPKVHEKLKKMQKGSFTRFDIFKGPLTDNEGHEILSSKKKLTQEDLEGLRKIEGRSDCQVCMDWFVDNVKGKIR